MRSEHSAHLALAHAAQARAPRVGSTFHIAAPRRVATRAPRFVGVAMLAAVFALAQVFA